MKQSYKHLDSGMGCKFDKKRVVLTCSTKKLPYLRVIVHLPPPLTLLPLPAALVNVVDPPDIAAARLPYLVWIGQYIVHEYCLCK
jgi:hypothetical protein